MSKNVYQFIDVKRIDPAKKNQSMNVKLTLLKFINPWVMNKVQAKQIVV